MLGVDLQGITHKPTSQVGLPSEPQSLGPAEGAVGAAEGAAATTVTTMTAGPRGSPKALCFPPLPTAKSQTSLYLPPHNPT